MNGKNCHDKKCRFNVGKLGTNKRCTAPYKGALMLCERPSRRQIDNILRGIGKQSEKKDCGVL